MYIESLPNICQVSRYVLACGGKTVLQEKFRLGLGVKSFLIGLMIVLSCTSMEGLYAYAARDKRAQLRISMVGPDVEYLQYCLGQAGYLNATIDGVFGPATKTAVIRLQKDAGLAADGIVGGATWQAIEDMLAAVQSIYVVQPGETLWSIAKRLDTTVSALVDANGIHNPDRLAVGEKLVVPRGRVPGKKSTTPAIRLMHWNDVQRIFAKGQKATIIDLKSGLRFEVRRLFGTNHADVEPLTAADTRIMKKAIGGKWSWNRRPIAIEVGGYRIAASMNGFPHGQSSIDNGFPGHFCIHFLGSRLHAGNRVDKDHQAAVLQAVGYGDDMDRLTPVR